MAALQALAAEITAKMIIPEQIEKLKSINLEFASSIKNGQVYQAMEVDELFHNYIVELSDNPYVATFNTSLQIHIRRFKYVFLKQPITATLASVEEHDLIIKAFEGKNSEDAHVLMKQNFIRPMQELNEIL